MNCASAAADPLWIIYAAVRFAAANFHLADAGHSVERNEGTMPRLMAHTREVPENEQARMQTILQSAITKNC